MPTAGAALVRARETPDALPHCAGLSLMLLWGPLLPLSPALGRPSHHPLPLPLPRHRGNPSLSLWRPSLP